ncbi:hypothetical protein DPMN_093190 [Dreissena polymorpha]|uniref:Amine oxidase n=2 Tax=Dreissena polymorpha TaxID=45954 RepID=A0A9D4L2I5_DREPO|nr:hypothetical protein DPMN_093190 [Dreissena polymorpha]
MSGMLTVLAKNGKDKKNEIQVPKEVVVVGGGMAGMAAARRLVKSKTVNVHVYEARKDRYGGRIWTNRDLARGVRGVDVDIGGMFLNNKAKNNPLVKLAEEFELETRNAGSLQVRIFDGKDRKMYSGVNATDLYREAFQIIIKAMQNVHYKSDISMSRLASEAIQMAYEQSDEAKTAPLFPREILEPLIRSFPTVMLQNFSSKFYDIQTDFGWDTIIVDGIGALLDRIVSGSSGLEPPLKVQLNKVLRNIQVDDKRKKVIIRTTDKKQVLADAVVIALPLGVLKSDALWFEPRLPEKLTKALDEIGIGYSGKIIVGFDEAFWPQEVGTFTACSDTAKNGFLQTWFNAYRLSGNPYLHGNILGDEAKVWETKPETELKAAVLKVLGEMFGEDIVNARKVTSFVVSEWSTDEFVQGSVSYAKVGNTRDIWQTLQEPVCPYIYFAGAYTESIGHVDSLHGAYNSGIRAAEQILDNFCTKQAKSKSKKQPAKKPNVIKHNVTMRKDEL